MEMCTSPKPKFFSFFFFFVTPHGTWDLSSPARDQTRGPCIGSMEF